MYSTQNAFYSLEVGLLEFPTSDWCFILSLFHLRSILCSGMIYDDGFLRFSSLHNLCNRLTGFSSNWPWTNVRESTRLGSFWLHVTRNISIIVWILLPPSLLAQRLRWNAPFCRPHVLSGKIFKLLSMKSSDKNVFLGLVELLKLCVLLSHLERCCSRLALYLRL